MTRIATLLLALVLATALPALAMKGHDSHGGSKAPAKEMSHDKGMDHGAAGHMGMSMEGEMTMLGKSEVEGVTAMAHINDVREAMAKAGQKLTHHLMLAFEGAEGKIDKGMVAVKVTGPDGTTAKPTMLMMMDGHFGVDLELTQKGNYSFEVGTKLADGKKRTFRFDYALK